jgi:hypothetical protein
VNRMLAFEPAEFLQLEFGTSFGHTNIGAVISLPALVAFQPNVFPFGFFSHTTQLCRTIRLHKVPVQIHIYCACDANPAMILPRRDLS